MRECGANVTLANGSTIRVLLELAVIAGDELGIKDVLESKGHAGAKPCTVCQNCALHTHARASAGRGLHQHSGDLVIIAETDVKKFKPPA